MSNLTWEQLDACERVDQIVDLLRAAGIRGRRGSPMWCPLARATNTNTRVYAAVRVSGGREIPLTQPQILFVRRLDRGKYPDLIEGT